MDVLVANDMPAHIKQDLQKTFTDLGAKAAHIDQQN